MIAVFLVLSKNVLYDYLLNIFKKKWTVYQSLYLIIVENWWEGGSGGGWTIQE
jgi:hypothetical protein